MRRRAVAFVCGMIAIAIMMLAINWHWWRGPSWALEIDKRCSSETQYPFYSSWCFYALRAGVTTIITDTRACMAIHYESSWRRWMRFVCIQLK
jgi:hypothetical protein